MTLATTDAQPRDVVRWESHGVDVALNVAFVREHFCKYANPHEALAFIRFAQAHQLNPFLKDVYLVKYGKDDPAQIIIAAHTWTKRASVDPRYTRHELGIIVQTADGLERRDSLFYLPSKTVVGGWAQVYLQDGSSFRSEVPIQERVAHTRDGRVTQFWSKMPATMIAKCALADCMRQAFPVLFSGAYDQSEVGDTHVALDGGMVIDSKAVNVFTGEIVGRAEEDDVDGMAHTGVSTPPVVVDATGEVEDESPAPPEMAPPLASPPASGLGQCEAHDRAWGKMPSGRIGHPVQGGDPCWRDEHEPEGGGEDQADEGGDAAALLDLQTRLGAFGWEWGNFQDEVLKMPWEEWLRLGQGVEVAWTRFEAFQSQQEE